MAAGRDFATTQADGGGSYSAPVNYAGTAPARITLHLGVIDMPYSKASYKKQKIKFARKGKANKPAKRTAEEDIMADALTKTTGEVAEILEEKYGILDAFQFARLPDIARSLEESIAGELETMMMGGRPSGNPFQGAESAITTMMKNFIAHQEVEHMGLEGVPTQAAKDGVNHRLKHPYAKANPQRPSFMDTTLYWQSLTAWFD